MLTYTTVLLPLCDGVQHHNMLMRSKFETGAHIRPSVAAPAADEPSSCVAAGLEAEADDATPGVAGAAVPPLWCALRGRQGTAAERATLPGAAATAETIT